MFKIVKSAHIEVITPSKLKVGDYILWAHRKAKVIKINELNKFITILNPIDDSIKSYVLLSTYIKIISCEEIETKEE